MRLFFVFLVSATLATAVCSCGSSDSSGPMEVFVEGGEDTGILDAPLADADASVDAHPEGSDAPIDTGTDTTTADSTADSPAEASGPSSGCDNAGLLAGCTVGVCTLSATGKPLPDGVSLTLAQKPMPADLNGDILGSALCSIGIAGDAGISGDAGTQSISGLTLSIALSTQPDPSAVLFQYVSSTLSREVHTSQPSGNTVVGLVSAPGDFGATKQPGPWSLQEEVGVDISSSGDQASLLRNLSSQGVTSAFYDGTHLFVCNGVSLLLYNGIPSDPSVKPDVVLGQADLNTTSTQTSSSLFGGRFGCGGLWSDGTRLVAAEGNRVLIWNTMPKQNAAPADLVLGQPDFSSNVANNGGVGPATLSSATSVDSDGTRLVVADRINNRVLIWSKFPTAIDQPADIAVGQPDLASNTLTGATTFYQAWGTSFASTGLFATGYAYPGLVHVSATTNAPTDFVALPIGGTTLAVSLRAAGRLTRMPNGWLAVRDGLDRRIGMFKTDPTGPGTIDVVLGQPDTTRVVSSLVSASVVASGASTEEGLGAGKLALVPDGSRLLIYDTPPTYNFEPASRVLGHAGFTTSGTVDYRGISALTLSGPADVAINGGVVAVADRGNNRVLLYRTTDLSAHNLGASVVLGQPDAASFVPNLDQRTPNASRMSGPAGVALDGTHLLVSDTENHRVLIWNSVPTSTATPADLVLGQADFSGRRPNRGRGDQNADGYSDAGADGFFSPMGVVSDGTHVFVADRLNNRVLVWNAFPTVSGQPADGVLGQADLTSSLANKGAGPFSFVGDGFNLPTGVTLIGTTLWVADTENNRLVRWDNATTTPVAGAWVGQSNGTTVANLDYYLDTEASPGAPRSPAPSTTATSILRPRAVALAGGRLYVSESESSRVHMLDATSFMPLGELGQSADSSGAANAVGVTASSLASPLGVATDGSTLWVADAGNHRVLGFGVATAPTTGAAANTVLGQPTTSTNGFNQASTAANAVSSQARGVALANGNLYVADTGNNRVLVLSTPVAAGQMPSSVYGQPDALQSLPNSGGAATSRTLNGPHGVAVDAAHVIVADTGNNRVLVYGAASAASDGGASPPSAQLVLGQADFTGTAANAGGVSASSMQAPNGAFSDGTSLWVADTGNHRVLVWTTFPTSNGQAADVVIGQPSFSAALSNQGGTSASASTLSFPSSVDKVAGIWYVADTGNNRVVFFSGPPAASGVAANGVLGQSDLTGRSAALTATDVAHLAGPIAIADDGANLYVVDRDLGRVMVYAIGTIASGAPASFSIGASGGLALNGPSAIAVERTPFFTSRVYIADTGNSQVAVVQSVSRLVSQ